MVLTQLCTAEDDDFDRRPPRKPYQEPVHLKVRKQLLAIAESVRH